MGDKTLKSKRTFSVKPFLKRVVPQPLRRLITPNRAFGQAFLRKGCDQTFSKKVCFAERVFAQAFFKKAWR
jgi:hypothetical protein